MKSTLVAFLFLLSGLKFTFAQSALSNMAVSRIELSSHPQTEPSSQLIFRHIQVIDERPDTARIGIHAYESPLTQKSHQVTFSSPAAAALSDWLNQHYTRSDAPYTALIVLRTLWLSDANFIRDEILQYPGLNNAQTCIRMRAEVYASRDDRYMALFRLDTLQINFKPNSGYQLRVPYPDWIKDLSGILTELIERSAATITPKEENNPVLTWDAIDSFNRSRFDYPVNSSPSLAPGVYANFHEFINNAPGIHTFRIEMDGKDQLLYLQDPAGKYTYDHTSWGYCDGTTIFVMKDGKLCPAWRENEALYFFDTSEKIIIPLFENPNDPNRKVSKKRNHIIYTVDMDTGASY